MNDEGQLKLTGFIVTCLILVIGGCYIKDAVNAQIEDYEARKEQAAREAENVRARTEQEARELSAKKEAEQKAFQQEDRLRTFILKEAPVLWTSYQSLSAGVTNQNARIDKLRETLIDFGKDPDADTDFRRICSMRDDMVGSLQALRKKIEDAFLAARKYEATPSKREYDESRRKLLEDGLQEAEAAVRKIENMIEQK